MLNWTDTTCYVNGRRGKVEPKAFAITRSGIKVSLTRDHIFYPDHWLLDCDRVGINDMILGTTADMSAEDAKREAIKAVTIALSMEITVKSSALEMFRDGAST